MHHFVTVTPGIVPAETLGCCWLHAQFMPKVSFFVLPLLPPFSRWNIDHCHFFWCVFYLDCTGGIPKCLCVGAKGPKGWNDMDYLRSSPFGFPSWCWSPARHPSEHNSWTKFDKLDGWSKSVWFRSVVTRLMVSNCSFFDPFKSLGKPNSQPMDWIHFDFGVGVQLTWHFPMCVALIWVAPKPWYWVHNRNLRMSNGWCLNCSTCMYLSELEGLWLERINTIH